MDASLPRTYRPWAIIEVTSDASSDERRMIIAGYRASRGGVVGLALRGVSTERVDRVLDDVVDPRDASFNGVLYLDGDDAGAVARAAAQAAIVIARTDSFRARLGGLGVRALDVAEGSARLALEARRPSA